MSEEGGCAFSDLSADFGWRITAEGCVEIGSFAGKAYGASAGFRGFNQKQHTDGERWLE